MKNSEIVYQIVWEDEVVDTTTSKKEAYILRHEYEMAFKSEVNIRKTIKA